jgi:hypothetical protein
VYTQQFVHTTCEKSRKTMDAFAVTRPPYQKLPIYPLASSESGVAVNLEIIILGGQSMVLRLSDLFLPHVVILVAKDDCL